MALEIEVKLPIKEPEKVKERLRMMGFAMEQTLLQTDTYFNSTAYDLKSQDKALRLRWTSHPGEEKGKHILTYKGPKLDQISMTRTELEVEISDPKKTEAILNGLGYVPGKVQVKKERISYRKGPLLAALDTVEGLGSFLELEMLRKDEEDREEGTREMERVITELGYAMTDTVRTSYLSQLEAKG